MSIAEYIERRTRPEYERTMSLREFSEYSPQRQEELIRNWLDKQTSLEQLLKKGHSNELHCGQSDKELLQRTIDEFKTCSSFANEDTVLDAANEMIYYYAKEIAQWLSNRSRDPKDRIFVRTAEIDDLNGYGIDENFNKKFTDRCTMVLERDMSASYDGKFFFYVKTIYPDIDKETSRPVANLRKEAQEVLLSSEKTDDITKTFWALKTSGYDVSYRMHPTHGLCIYGNYDVGPYKCSVMINKDSFLSRRPFIRVQDNAGKWINMFEREDLPIDIKNAIERSANRIMSIHSMIVGNDIAGLKNVFEQNNNREAKGIEQPNRDDENLDI